MLRGKQGNLSKVKYHLPNYKVPPALNHHQEDSRKAVDYHRKRSSTNIHARSME